MKTIFGFTWDEQLTDQPNLELFQLHFNFVFLLGAFWIRKSELCLGVTSVLELIRLAPAFWLSMLIRCLNLKFMTWFLLCLARSEHALPTQVIPLNHAWVILAWSLFEQVFVTLENVLTLWVFSEENDVDIFTDTTFSLSSEVRQNRQINHSIRSDNRCQIIWLKISMCVHENCKISKHIHPKYTKRKSVKMSVLCFKYKKLKSWLFSLWSRWKIQEDEAGVKLQAVDGSCWLLSLCGMIQRIFRRITLKKQYWEPHWDNS